MKLLGDNKVVAGYHLGKLGEKDPELLAKPMRELIRLYDEGKIKPEIHTVYSLEEVRSHIWDV